jgi:hypothetical protein
MKRMQVRNMNNEQIMKEDPVFNKKCLPMQEKYTPTEGFLKKSENPFSQLYDLRVPFLCWISGLLDLVLAHCT